MTACEKEAENVGGALTEHDMFSLQPMRLRAGCFFYTIVARNQ